MIPVLLKSRSNGHRAQDSIIRSACLPWWQRASFGSTFWWLILGKSWEGALWKEVCPLYCWVQFCCCLALCRFAIWMTYLVSERLLSSRLQKVMGLFASAISLPEVFQGHYKPSYIMYLDTLRLLWNFSRKCLQCYFSSVRFKVLRQHVRWSFRPVTALNSTYMIVTVRSTKFTCQFKLKFLWSFRCELIFGCFFVLHSTHIVLIWKLKLRQSHFLHYRQGTLKGQAERRTSRFACPP